MQQSKAEPRCSSRLHRNFLINLCNELSVETQRVPDHSVPGVAPSVPPSVRESVCQMFYSIQLRVFLAPGCFIRKEGGGEGGWASVLWVSKMGSRLLHVSKPAGPPQANIKQPEHLFPDAVPRSAFAQMKRPQSFWLWGNCTKIKDVALFKWWNRMVFNWWMFQGLVVMLSLFKSNTACFVM